MGADAQPAGPRAAPSRENRFLFILETSAATKRIAEASQQAVEQLLSDDIVGQMKPGDSFSIWTYNEKLNTGQFPAQRWNPETRRNTLRQVTNFLSGVKFEKNGRFEAVRPALETVTQNSPKLTIILLTDGKQRVSGLKFDPEINKLFDDNYSAMRAAKMPFISILVARSGEFVAFTVNSTLGPIKYPPPPARMDVAAETTPSQPSVHELTEPASVAPSAKEPTTLPVAKTPTPPPPIIVAEPAKPALGTPTPPQDPRLIPSGPTPTFQPKPIEANLPAAAQPAAANVDAQILKPANVSIPTPAPREAAAGTAAEIPPESKVMVAIAAKLKETDNPAAFPLTSNAVSNAGKPGAAKPTIAVIAPVEITTGRRSLLTTAFVLLVVAVFLGYLLLRPKRNPSLITKSMHRIPK